MELCFTPAARLAQMLRKRKISATELMRSFIAQIERVNPKVNAIVTFVPERALSAAKVMDRKKIKPLLGGLPIAYKDLVPTRGIRSTSGSLVFKDHVPAEDHAIASRRRERSRWARPTRRNSARAARPSTRCSARRATPTIPPRPAAAPRAARRRRSRAACCPSPTARTSRRA
jgi:hypothetical protein